MSSVVAERFRPTLPDLIGSGGRSGQILGAGLVAVIALAVAAVLVITRDRPVERYINRAGVPFNFSYVERLKPLPPGAQSALGPARGREASDAVWLEEARRDLFVQSFAVSERRLPPYQGEVGGLFPLVAEGEKRRLAERFTGFELVSEGKARVNEVAGYQLVFRARLGERRLYGREVLLGETVPGSRRAVALLLLGTPVSGIGRVADVGNDALLKQPLRSFRFGTEPP